MSSDAVWRDLAALFLSIKEGLPPQTRRLLCCVIPFDRARPVRDDSWCRHYRGVTDPRPDDRRPLFPSSTKNLSRFSQYLLAPILSTPHPAPARDYATDVGVRVSEVASNLGMLCLSARRAYASRRSQSRRIAALSSVHFHPPRGVTLHGAYALRPTPPMANLPYTLLMRWTSAYI